MATLDKDESKTMAELLAKLGIKDGDVKSLDLRALMTPKKVKKERFSFGTEEDDEDSSGTVVPKLTWFSGTTPIQKGHVSYTAWKHEVKGLTTIYPIKAVIQAIKRSLKSVIISFYSLPDCLISLITILSHLLPYYLISFITRLSYSIHYQIISFYSLPEDLISFITRLSHFIFDQTISFHSLPDYLISFITRLSQFIITRLSHFIYIRLSHFIYYQIISVHYYQIILFHLSPEDLISFLTRLPHSIISTSHFIPDQIISFYYQITPDYTQVIIVS